MQSLCSLSSQASILPVRVKTADRQNTARNINLHYSGLQNCLPGKMKPVLDIVTDIGDEEYLDEVHGDDIHNYPANYYVTEHEEADAVITKYVNDGDKAFRELLHMLEQHEPKMEARIIKPFSSENSSAEWLISAIICLSLMAVMLFITILTVLIRRRLKANPISEDKSK